MPTQTWSFDSGFEGWTFTDDSDAGSSASRSHVSGAIRNTLINASLPFNTVRAINDSSLNINATIAPGDTIEVDYSANSDAPTQSGKTIWAFYQDGTNETIHLGTGSGAGTLTLTMSVNKTLDFIRFRFQRSTSGTAIGSTFSADMLEVRLITAAAVTPTAGKLRTPTAFIDEQGAGAAGGAGGNGGGNIASISADGLFIYIASFNNLGFPTLIKISAAGDADGSVVFNPGAGGRIGVQCGKFDANTVWIAGAFDSTNVIEKSEDAGSSFSVKDNAAIGTIRTFEVGPLADNTLLVMDGDNGDILETVDDGATWTTINSSVTPLMNSISRFTQNTEEVAFVNQGDATNSANYSVNSGANLEDYQTGVYPNANGTKVITT